MEDAVFERVQKVDIIFNFVGGGNQFSFCHATEAARCIRKMRSLSARKNGTALVIKAIPPNLKLLPSNRKHLILLGLSDLNY